MRRALTQRLLDFDAQVLRTISTQLRHTFDSLGLQCFRSFASSSRYPVLILKDDQFYYILRAFVSTDAYRLWSLTSYRDLVPAISRWARRAPTGNPKSASRPARRKSRPYLHRTHECIFKLRSHSLGKFPLAISARVADNLHVIQSERKERGGSKKNAVR